jgi:hypothetical protein
MSTTALIAAGIVLLLIVAAGVAVLWTADARRAEQVATDPDRVEGQPPQRHRWQRGSDRS